jgi:pyruvate,water dikinase
VKEGIVEIKGMVACKSNKKIRGVVKVVEESKYISKIKKGDILVANETTPDFIIGMKVAGAIVTNQGGITSHAAITSREMGIPCIIATKIATKVLKDGDLIEVDADKGTIKILKRR